MGHTEKKEKKSPARREGKRATHSIKDTFERKGIEHRGPSNKRKIVRSGGGRRPSHISARKEGTCSFKRRRRGGKKGEPN